jgi:hypothetical protein
MSGFLYFFIGDEFRNAPTDEQLKEMKLEHLVGATFSQAAWGGNETMEGAGVICAIAQSGLSEGGTEPKVGYYPDTQQWVAGGEKWWIGWEKDSRPGPVDLVRGEQMPGYEVKLGDGGLWLVPCERFLPRTLKLDGVGEVQRVPLAKFAAMGEKTAVAWDEYRAVVKARDKNKVDDLFSIRSWIEMGNHFLGVNYWVGRIEANELNLWNDQTLVTTVEAILDIPGLVKMEGDGDKKKESPGGG